MNLQELIYFAAIAEHRHFGRAAKACHVSQPTLSAQLRKLEQHLGVALFERTNKSVTLTSIGEKLLVHASNALAEVRLLESAARASRDQLAGQLKLGVIPTLAPYLMPLILTPLRKAYPQLTIELWEDLTHSLLDLMRDHRLDAALIATEVSETDLTALALFVEPFFAVLPENHPLAQQETIRETDLARDLLVLADGHCLASQALSACKRKGAERGSFQAASLDTLVNLVAAGYGTTLIPGLAAENFRKPGVVVRPLAGGTSRTVRLASRPAFPRRQALRAIEKVMGQEVPYMKVRTSPSANSVSSPLVGM